MSVASRCSSARRCWGVAALLGAYRQADPTVTVDRLDLFDRPLPIFDHDAAMAKRT